MSVLVSGGADVGESLSEASEQPTAVSMTKAKTTAPARVIGRTVGWVERDTIRL